MRRNEREVKEIPMLLEILDACKVCRIAVWDAAGPYIVPMNFGYTYEQDKLTLFFHSAKEGRKMKALRQSAQVAFEMDCAHQLLPGKTACEYGFAYKSVTGAGHVRFLEDGGEKKRALSILMKAQTGGEFAFDGKMAAGVAVFAIEVSTFTGKQRERF